MPDLLHRDARLVDGVLAGRDDSWRLLVCRYAPYMMAAIGRFSRDYDERMAIFLEVLERLRRDDFARLRSFAFRSSLATWLTVVARRTALDVLRSRYGRDFRRAGLRDLPLDAAPQSTPGLADGHTPEQELLQRERSERRRRLQAALAGALACLDDRDAMLLQAVYGEGLRIADAGRLLGVKPVYKRLQGALQRLRRELAQRADGLADDPGDLFQGDPT